jgi:hypothetical protein
MLTSRPKGWAYFFSLSWLVRLINGFQVVDRPQFRPTTGGLAFRDEARKPVTCAISSLSIMYNPTLCNALYSFPSSGTAFYLKVLSASWAHSKRC